MASERYLLQLEGDVFFQNSVIDQETQLLLYRAIQSLPERERRIFELGFIEGLKNADIAVELNVSESTVKKTESESVGYFAAEVTEGVVFVLLFILMG